jgi:phosphatidylglycerophosphatase A
MSENINEYRQMDSIKKTIIIFIAQGAYIGRLPVAPGTAGTLVGALIYILMRAVSPAAYLVLCSIVILAGAWTAGRAEAYLGRKDPPSIVIDEIAGYLVAMFMVPREWGFVITGFLLFRIFDITKPYPLKRLQDLDGGIGVMVDDVGAGVYTNLVLQAASIFLSHQV